VSAWIETYRGVVYRWEVDHNDHLTVAYYFARLDAATLGLLQAVGLAEGSPGRAWVTADCYVRYQRELRVGDIMHVESAPLAVDEHGVSVGHRLLDSDTGAVASTFEQRLDLQEADGRPATLSPAERARVAARCAAWDGPPRERRARPRALAALRDTARDVIEPWESDVFGRAGLAAYVHRFSAANSHALAAFGMTPAYQRDQRRGFSTFEFQFSAAGTLRPGTGVVVRSAILHVGSSSLRLFHRMCDARTGAEVAALHQLGVHLDHDARRPAPLPGTLADKARALIVASEEGSGGSALTSPGTPS
jgi:acyl-CoA thioester hydrolase